MTGIAAEQADKALNFSLTHELYNGTEFEQVRRVQTSETKKATQTDPITLLHADVVEKAPLIITPNKSPTQWAEVLKDTVLTTALLDRILYLCEIIKLTGNSYRMDNRKTIFENTNKTANLLISRLIGLKLSLVTVQ